MTYNVFGGTLNLTQSNQLVFVVIAVLTLNFSAAIDNDSYCFLTKTALIICQELPITGRFRWNSLKTYRCADFFGSQCTDASYIPVFNSILCLSQKLLLDARCDGSSEAHSLNPVS